MLRVGFHSVIPFNFTLGLTFTHEILIAFKKEPAEKVPLNIKLDCVFLDARLPSVSEKRLAWQIVLKHNYFGLFTAGSWTITPVTAGLA